MASWLLEQAAKAQTGIGKTISKIGGVASYIPGVKKDIRIGGGGGIGAAIAQGVRPSQATPYFNVANAQTVPVDYSQYRSTQNFTPNPTTDVYGGQVKGTSDTNTNNNIYGDLQNSVSQGQGEDLDLINQEFEQAMNEFAAQEGQVIGAAGVAEGKVRAEGQGYENTLTQNKAESEGVVAGQETQARKEEAGGLRNARDIFRQIQQENIAKLSGMGISSSSVAEALAERLGVETARRIAGITGSTQEVITNLNNERLRIQKVFTDKVAQVKESVQSQIAEIQNNLMASINTINASRGRAALQKAQARTGIIQDARNQINDLKIKAAEYEQRLRDVAAKRAQDIANTIPLFKVGDTGIQQLNPIITQQYEALSKLSPNTIVTPETGLTNGVPSLKGYTLSQKKNTEEDDFEGLI